MAFAFASGVAGGMFAETLDRATPPPSTWQATAFLKDLFLDDFVARCYRARIEGHEPVLSTSYLVRLLASPPSNPSAIEFRRDILAELVDTPSLRAAFERLYQSLCRFRAALEGAAGSKIWDSNRRQLDILSIVKDVFDQMAEGFAAARSGLSRLHEFGTSVRSSEPFRSLSDLLQYEDHLATLNLKVRVGADGRIRAFEVFSIQENQDNPFASSTLRRWLAKLELLVRGFKFGDGEVMARLIDAVFEGVAPDVAQFVQLLGDLEFYLGALGFRDGAHRAGLAVCLPTLVDAHEPRALARLFNPLLLAHGTKPVPCDLRTDRHDTTVLVTGPNSGGKTRLLQAVGLAQVLAQNGAFVPAQSANIALCAGLVMSLVQETKADQSEGRLGMELIRIRQLFESLPPGAMVILDELCSGTNPSEGEEIFELVVQVLTKLRPQAFITTHFLTFAARLEREQAIHDLRFFQVELDPQQCPTFQFVPGVARTSLAQHAAARLGVTGEQLLALVERNLQRASGRISTQQPPPRPSLPLAGSHPSVAQSDPSSAPWLDGTANTASDTKPPPHGPTRDCAFSARPPRSGGVARRMRTFLANSRMAPELVARIERSIGSSRVGGRHARFDAVPRASLLGVIPLVAAGAAVIMVGLFLAARWQQRQQVEQARAALLGRVRTEGAFLTQEVETFLPRVEGWVHRLAHTYDGDRIASEIREGRSLAAQLERPVVYVRGDLEALASTDRFENAAAASLKDSFLLCLYERPESRTEGALLNKLRGMTPGGALVDRRTSKVYRLHDAEAGLRVLQTPWLQRIERAEQPKDLNKLTSEFDRAPIEKAKHAVLAEVLIAVIDEPSGSGSSELDSERPHDVRVAMVDLRADQVLLQVRRRVDPAWLSPGTRAVFARGADGCALAIDVHDAVGAGG